MADTANDTTYLDTITFLTLTDDFDGTMDRDYCDDLLPTHSPAAARVSLTAFPNPTDGSVRFGDHRRPVRQVTVFDLLGRSLFSKQNPDGEEPLWLGQLPPGVYLVRHDFRDGSFATNRVVRR